MLDSSDQYFFFLIWGGCRAQHFPEGFVNKDPTTEVSFLYNCYEARDYKIWMAGNGRITTHR